MSTPESPGGPPELPDFQRGTGSGSHSAPQPPADGGLPDTSGPARRPRTGWLIGGCLTAFALLLALVLIVVLVVMPRLAGGDPIEDPTPTAQSPSEPPEGEYVPTESEEPAPAPQEAPTEVPASSCYVAEPGTPASAPAGTLVGGGLQTPIPDGWENATAWRGAASYTTDMDAVTQQAGQGWYSYAVLGRGDFPEAEGGYPGAEVAATWIFQCSITRDDVHEIYGEQPDVQNWVSEPVTIDGMNGHRISGDTVLIEEAGLDFTDTWGLTVIVLDTPHGPAVFLAGAASDLPEQVADQQAMVAGLRAA